MLLSGKAGEQKEWTFLLISVGGLSWSTASYLHISLVFAISGAVHSPFDRICSLGYLMLEMV